MLYVDFSAGNKDYKLRLNTRGVLTLEKKLGCNPLAIFGDGKTIPTLTTMVSVLHASLQHYHHGITEEGACDIFDDFLEDGHSMVDFLAIIVDIYKSAGLIKNEDENEKN